MKVEPMAPEPAASSVLINDRHCLRVVEGLLPIIVVDTVEGRLSEGEAGGLFDRDYVVTGASALASELFGSAATERFIGKSIHQLLGPGAELHEMMSLGVADVTRPFELELTMPSGELTQILAMACPVDGSKTALTLAISLREGAERRRSRLDAEAKRFRKLFDEVPTALWWVDGRFTVDFFGRLKSEGVVDIERYFDEHPEIIEQGLDEVRIVDANALALAKFGRGIPGELHLPVRHFWQNSKETFRRILTAKFKGASDYSEETKIRTLDGELTDVLFTTMFPPLDEPRSNSLISMIDISDRVRAEGELRRLQAQFAHASRLSLLGELTASIAHEISQPLSAISTNGDTALRWLRREEPNVAQAMARLDRIVGDSKRAGDVVQRMRSLARPQVSARGPISLNENAVEAMRLIRPELHSRHILIDHALQGGLPQVSGDAVQIQQVIANLLINSIQAIENSSAHNGKWINLVTSRSGKAVELSVEDSGPGIDPQDLDFVFDGFFTTKSDGMGMGLAISRSIAMSHNGELSARNSARGGALFTLRLPILQ